MAAKAKLNVQNFPRPPLLELTPRHLVIKWNNQTLADTKSAYWVLGTVIALEMDSAPLADRSRNNSSSE